jgi:hypothetical protein
MRLQASSKSRARHPGRQVELVVRVVYSRLRDLKVTPEEKLSRWDIEEPLGRGSDPGPLPPFPI